MTQFHPIAIIGQGCVLPGALSPEALWQIVADGRQLISSVPKNYWGIDPALVATTSKNPELDKTWTDKGGFVAGFDDVFEPSGFQLPEDQLTGLDNVFKWGLHAGREALRSAGHDLDRKVERAGVILGNKSYPTRSMADLAENFWRQKSGWPPKAEGPEVDPRNRFMSGLPAQIIARSLGLGGNSFSLDVACASSLYAIKLACDRLQKGEADLMLAGGVNRADDLLLHIGFCALQAMSKTGQSRPFHRDADGLVPAEGAAIIALKRLEDAVADGDNIRAVIRGVGLSNDGRSRGLLTPSEEGQVRSMQRAYQGAGLQPKDLSLVECHAAGTALGDATEVRSVSRVFADVDERLPIASMKSNLGHLITVSGVAAVLKLTAAMEHQTCPATLNADDPIDELKSGPLRHLTESEPWNPNGPRRAAINNFGFGGNNAHLILEEFQPDNPTASVAIDLKSEKDPEAIAVVAMSVVAADGKDEQDFARALFYNESRVTTGPDGKEARAEDIKLDVGEVRFPPRDLQQTLPQQLMILEAAMQLSDKIATLPTEATGISLGMQCDIETCRYLVRWRLGPELTQNGEDHRDVLIGAAEAAGVLGTMPNLVTNRLNSQFDLRGPSMTLSGEEVSGMMALELAGEALRNGELEAAVVGAVDLSCEPVHRAVVEELLPEDRHIPGDAAVVLILKRLSDAQEAEDDILALLPGNSDKPFSPYTDREDEVVPDLVPLFGHSHSASGLLRVAAAIEASSRRTLPATELRPAMPWLPDYHRQTTLSMNTLMGDSVSTVVTPYPERPAQRFVDETPPTLHVYTGADLSDLTRNLKSYTESEPTDGPIRLVITARNAGEHKSRVGQALLAIGELDSPPPFDSLGRGIYIGDGSIEGETSFVFTGPAGSYEGMGRELTLAMPELVDAVAERANCSNASASWIYAAPGTHVAGPANKLWGSAFMCQIHAELTRNILGLKPEAAIGFCAGETNALFAMGAWSDFDGLYIDLEQEHIFDQRIGGEYTAVRDTYDLKDGEADWATWRILAPVEKVEAAMAGEKGCYITIVNAPGDLVLGGEPKACDRVIEKVGKQVARPLGYNVAMHCEAMASIEELWFDLHHKPTEPVEGVRFYTHSTLDHYQVNAELAAQALVGQALNRVDFPKLINKAYDDGVRVFIEHGPRAGCTRWIQKILGDRTHLAVSLDRTGKDSLTQAVDTTARLLAAGVDVDHKNLMDRLATAEPLLPLDQRSSAKNPRMLTFPAHLPAVILPPQVQKTQPTQQPQQQQTAKQTGQSLPYPPILPSVATALPQITAPTQHAQPTQPEIAQPRIFQPSQQHAAPPEPPVKYPEVQNHPTSTERPQTVEGQLAEMHAEFLQERAQLHQEFLEQQHRTSQWFLEMAQGGAPMPVQTQSFPVRNQPPANGLTTRAPSYLTEMTEAPQAQNYTTNGAAPTAATPAPVSTPAPSAPTAEPIAEPMSEPTSELQEIIKRAQDPERFNRPNQFDRKDLEIHAGGKISEIFGPLFARQDDCFRQVRMPEPPLLLVDRVTGIDAEPGAMEKKGVIWTETDIQPDAWYLHRGRVPVGITVEAGQADLMLISWMGADFQNKNERIYRLLGCDQTFYGELPKPGDTLQYEIHIDEHARSGAVRLFFFHYDLIVNGELRLSVRDGQAGFFTDEELANSDGVLWKPADMPAPTTDPVAPVALPEATSFGLEKLEAFAAGRAYECFGKGFEKTAAHTETPNISGGDMLFFDEIQEFDPTGGPHGRGYLRAVQKINPDIWFFSGHFKNDPCMPGTLMLEGCIQTMAFYLAAIGFTLDRDGWRFEPVSDHNCKMRCRGQVTPTANEVIYELFVHEVEDGDQPRLYADLLCTVDGRKAFHCDRFGLELVPDWPLERHPEWIEEVKATNHSDVRQVAEVNGFKYDQASIVNCALGRPSSAFGEMYTPFDGHLRTPRLPRMPYLFISRIAEIQGAPAGMDQNSSVVAEYDVPHDAWYFDDGISGTMPFSVLMEVGLQPCGWLASYIGSTLTTDQELFFRNLDGTGTVHCEITRDTKRLRTEAKLKTLSQAGAMIIVGFDVQTFADDELAFSMDTVFGFFPAASLAKQAGLATSDELKARRIEEAPTTLENITPLKLRDRQQAETFSMFDRITGLWPDGGEAGLGRIRSKQDVDPNSWYFNAHFFQDPVQPGSLGVEGMLQLLQTWMVAEEMDEHVENARFVPIMHERPTTWKYRGQVSPDKDHVVLDLEITERSDVGAEQPYAVATASLWVDDIRLYEVKELAVQIVSGGTPTKKKDDDHTEIEHLDPLVDTWIGDHRPTFTRPVLPLMLIADRLANAAQNAADAPAVELNDVHLRSWAFIDGPTDLITHVQPEEDHHQVSLSVGDNKLATAHVRCAHTYPEAPAPIAPPTNTEEIVAPYESGSLFHGPAFQLLTSGHIGTTGSEGILKASHTEVPTNALHPALLDAALHIIPHDSLHRWSDEVEEDTVGYPHKIEFLTLHGPTPTEGDITVRVQLLNVESGRFLTFHIQFLQDEKVWADMHLVEALFPKGRLGRGNPTDRRAFLRDAVYTEDLGLSRFQDGKTHLTVKELRQNDWFEGTVANVYNLPKDLDLLQQTRQVAIKDHLARKRKVHPSIVDTTDADVQVDNPTPTEFIIH